jgi:hypothetical protein
LFDRKLIYHQYCNSKQIQLFTARPLGIFYLSIHLIDIIYLNVKPPTSFQFPSHAIAIWIQKPVYSVVGAYLTADRKCSRPFEVVVPNSLGRRHVVRNYVQEIRVLLACPKSSNVNVINYLSNMWINWDAQLRLCYSRKIDV